MNIWDVLILLLVAGAVITAMHFLRKKDRKSGCSCGCSGCTADCNAKKQK